MRTPFAIVLLCVWLLGVSGITEIWLSKPMKEAVNKKIPYVRSDLQKETPGTLSYAIGHMLQFHQVEMR